MIYPEFIKKNDLIGICAPSKGVGHKLNELKISNRYLRSLGYKVKETSSVRNDSEPSTTAQKRAKELDELVLNNKVKSIMCAAGGDFMLEMMPYVNFDHIKDNPKWISGMSDPTNLLFTITTKLDIATLYGKNGASFSFDNKSQDIFLKYLNGNIEKQKSYKKYINLLDEINGNNIFNDVKWISNNEQHFNGRLIGGCIDVINKLIGTKFDYTNDFINRYKDDGIVWYFDIFALSSYDFYLTLLQFKNAGWFRYCKGVLVGRVAFPSIEDKKLDYYKVCKKALDNIPFISEMDIGHTYPYMTLINGALISVNYKNNKGNISFNLN